ncbi:MAG: sulfite exporter TauE/SafE family protein [Legionella sp.]|nr:sulfite exporter TauE/SafE family protein [Legionella sp.]
MIAFIIFTILVLTVYCIYQMLAKLKQQPITKLTLQEKIKFAITGILAFFSDVIGLGSFAVNIALLKYFKLVEDAELPIMCNGAQIIPGTLASLFFLQAIQVDVVMLATLVLGASIGGILGGSIVTRLSQQKIRLAMIVAFAGMILLVGLKQLGFIPENGQLLVLGPWQLALGFFMLIICGSLTSVGIGLFGQVQAVLFLLGVSPIAAFPIMTAAGAMQQPLTTLIFLKHDKIPLKKALLLSLFGCIGVLIGLPVVSHLSPYWLHNLLLCVMLYNLISIGLAYWRKKQPVPAILQAH